MALSLHLEVSNGNIEKVKELIEAGTCINLQDENKNTPIHLASFYGNLDIVRYLKRDPLKYAIEDYKISIASYLISVGADVNIKDSDNRSPLLYAIRYSLRYIFKISFLEYKKLISELIEAGSDINSQDILGNTPFIELLEIIYDRELFELFIEKGADIHAKKINGANTLMIAARNGNIEHFNYLLNAGVDINHSDRNGNTTFFYAAEARCPKILNYFSLNLGLTLMSEMPRTPNKRASLLCNNTTGIRQELDSEISWYKWNIDKYADMIEELFTEDKKRARLLQKWNIIMQEQRFKMTTVTVRLLIASHLSDDHLEMVCKH
ncbi:hypothetical protein LAZ67_16001636 [Cordylochernes scorpioides]|uniref:Ankyrin repeat protein n=1 Tax=Cordylochernes scorpioides TaxID=51811 RepID=A0ABY6LBB9_9ARAC|nr:hypothetical protein LAZ67_16001636 [Cordylochernes scorpioides]